MTLATLPPLQLALALDVVVDAPTPPVIPPRPALTVTYHYEASDRVRLEQAIKRLQWGDGLHSHPYRLERHAADRDFNGNEHREFYILTRHAEPVWKVVADADDGDSLQRWYRRAAFAMAVYLCEHGVTDWFTRRCELRYCGIGAGVSALELEQESDEAAEEVPYNGVDCDRKQEALVTVPMRIDVYGYDDDEVTLRDGTINVVQEGYPFRVSGSRSFIRDPRLSRLNPTQVSRAIRMAARIGLPLMSAPAHLKWCSEHETPKYVDPRLLVSDPVAYWAQRGFVPRHQFSDAPLVRGKPKYSDGKVPVCKECRARHERMMYAAIKQQQGEAVRTYNRRTDARPRATARRAVA